MDSTKVLIIDDEAEFVNALVERLELRGFSAKGYTSGEEALAAMESEDFDVAVVDVRMPGLGGLDVVERIKRRWPQRQVILLTGHGSVEDAEKGIRLGACNYLMKPVPIEKLVEYINRACGKKGDGGRAGG